MKNTKLYLIKEVANELNCSYRTVQAYIYDKKIKAIKIGGKWQVSQEELDYIKKNGLRV